jgi:anaphase-promoting complex subunit 1
MCAQKDAPTSVGLLLGLAAGKRGSMDAQVAKTLSIHVPALFPAGAVAVDIPPLIHSAALAALGYLYLGTGHRRTTEVLLAEIGRTPSSRPGGEGDREVHALSAGLALGMVALGRGERGVSDLRLPERLMRLVEGGPRMGPGNSLARGTDPTFAGEFAAVLAARAAADTHERDVLGNTVSEGPRVNVNVTCPGATLALGLMYLRTHDRAAAARLALPDTPVCFFFFCFGVFVCVCDFFFCWLTLAGQFLLDGVRPDFMLLRTLSRALILWNDIGNTREWVESLCPPVVRVFALGRKSPPPSLAEGADLDEQSMRQAYVNIVAGGCFAIGLRYVFSPQLVCVLL